MTIPKRILLVLGLTPSLAASVAAQNYDPTSFFISFSSREHKDTITITASPPLDQRFPFVRGAPFYGEELNQRIVEEAGQERARDIGRSARIWRDFEGRFRVEQHATPDPEAAQRGFPDLVTICDLPAGVMYFLDPQHKVAHRFTCEGARPLVEGPPRGRDSSESAQPHSPPPPDPSAPSYKFEQLGQKVIGGVLATGTRSSTIYPVGFEGNDRPITNAIEIWTSPELKLDILKRSSNPKLGTHVRSVTNISRAEADPSLFQVPPGFTIVDESGPFSFTLTRGPSQ